MAQEIKGFYKIIPLGLLRKTPGVIFDYVPRRSLPRIDAVDRVLHQPGAFSPASVGEAERPWYMHPFQEDHLLVLHGTRWIDLYTPEHGRQSFEITPTEIRQTDKTLSAQPAILAWPCRVFHRVLSCSRQGSAAVNFAVRHDGFDIKTNFNVYDVDTRTGSYRILREGYLDQPFENPDI
jgi:hypothetical protein